MFCVMCAIDIFFYKIMKSKFCVKKCQENVLQFMFLYIIRTPLLELKSVGKSADYTRGKTVCVASLQNSPLVGNFWFAFLLFYLIVIQHMNMNISKNNIFPIPPYLPRYEILNIKYSELMCMFTFE